MYIHICVYIYIYIYTYIHIHIYRDIYDRHEDAGDRDARPDCIAGEHVAADGEDQEEGAWGREIGQSRIHMGF